MGGNRKNMVESTSNGICAGNLARMLLGKSCCVLDARDAASKLARPFPGSQKEDISLGSTAWTLASCRSSIMARFKNDGRQLVIIAKVNEEAMEYCEFLISTCSID